MPPGAARRAPAARRTPTAPPARTSAGGYTGTYENGSAKKGGTYTVGWEQSFGFTDNFDPTGEYLGNAWGILDNLLVRPLIGYKHASGADGNELIGDLATVGPDADRQRPDLHVQAPGRDQVRPAGQPCDHL